MNHFDYMMQKRENTISEWDELMQLNGMFKDLQKIKTIRDSMNKDGDNE